jgi:hypothetical protein
MTVEFSVRGTDAAEIDALRSAELERFCMGGWRVMQCSTEVRSHEAVSTGTGRVISRTYEADVVATIGVP